MPSKVGHITKIYDNGAVRVRNDIDGEEWFGQIVVGSGGMLMFNPVDERGVSVGAHIIEADAVTTGAVGPDGGRAEDESEKRTPVSVGKKGNE